MLKIVCNADSWLEKEMLKQFVKGTNWSELRDADFVGKPPRRKKWEGDIWVFLLGLIADVNDPMRRF